MGVIVAATKKLRSQSGEPMTKAEIEKLRVDLRSEHYISGDRNRKTPRQMTQTEVDFMIANSHLSCNLIADELQAMGFDRTRQVVWQKMKALTRQWIDRGKWEWKLKYVKFDIPESVNWLARDKMGTLRI